MGLFRMRILFLAFLMTAFTTGNSALAESPSDGFHGDFYNPIWDGGCYKDGLVYHVTSDRIVLFAHGDERTYIDHLKATNTLDQFVVEGVPSTNDKIKKEMKKVSITYKSVEGGFTPVAMTVDNDVLDVQQPSAHGMLENYYSLQRCDSPSFTGWLLMNIGWHTAYESPAVQQ
jgi:hypothetical protein